jgi:hypothetical protein
MARGRGVFKIILSLLKDHTELLTNFKSKTLQANCTTSNYASSSNYTYLTNLADVRESFRLGYFFKIPLVGFY